MGGVDGRWKEVKRWWACQCSSGDLRLVGHAASGTHLAQLSSLPPSTAFVPAWFLGFRREGLRFKPDMQGTPIDWIRTVHRHIYVGRLVARTHCNFTIWVIGKPHTLEGPR